ncbi:putative reverse transcriptase domain-containing protein [Tanacetum coccineum]
MDDLNITIGEYIRLEEEKAQNHSKVFNWETAKYGKTWYDEDVHDLRSIENEFPAIAFNDSLKSGETLSCEPTVRSLNDEIDFKILFDDFDDEDYIVIFDKNSFSYKIISTSDLKTDSENDNKKINMPSLPPPEPAVSYFDDLDFFIDFKNEFPAIVYNDAQTSKSDLLTKPTLNPQDIDGFDLKDETSLSEYNEEEQIFLYFNDLFLFNIIQPDDLKLEKDNDDNEINIKQSSGGRYGVSVPALTKDHDDHMINTPYPEKTNTPYWKYRRSIQQCMKSGVAKHLGVVGTQQQNGLVDETNVTLFAKLSCFLIQSSMSKVFRAEDTTRSIYLVNRSPSSAIGFKKPTDMLGFLVGLLVLSKRCLNRLSSSAYSWIQQKYSG